MGFGKRDVSGSFAQMVARAAVDARALELEDFFRKRSLGFASARPNVQEPIGKEALEALRRGRSKGP